MALCVPTYHVCNEYVTYIVAMWLEFGQLDDCSEYYSVATMSSLVSQPDHTSHKENGLVNQVQFLGLEAPLQNM